MGNRGAVNMGSTRNRDRLWWGNLMERDNMGDLDID
jgi:hypothetical protein